MWPVMTVKKPAEPGRDQGSARLPARSDQLAESAQPHGHGTAEKTDPPVSLRAETGRWAVPRQVRSGAEFDALFSVLDRKAKLYWGKDDVHGQQRAALGRLLPPTTALAAAFPRGA